MSINLVFRPPEFWCVEILSCSRLRACGCWYSLDELKEKFLKVTEEVSWLRPGETCSMRCPRCGTKMRYFRCKTAVYRFPAGVATGLGKNDLPTFTVVENLYWEECERKKYPYLFVYNCASRCPAVEWNISHVIKDLKQEHPFNREWYFAVLKPHITGIPISISAIHGEAHIKLENSVDFVKAVFEFWCRHGIIKKSSIED